MTRYVNFLPCSHGHLIDLYVGWRRALDDIHHGSAYHFCWMWTGVLHSTTFVDIDTDLVQTYTDLRQLRVANVVQAILKD
jgi:hypothetical protein